ncbi:MAG: STAS domain-containing protein [Bacteroidales bacterium]|jgi:anti-sigma B factor antagonist|nr:STAS domain-containing protein [Bacteroidales bacterium]MBQ1906409.1 STAS domain-containing protein [Bacteroidales bacterium]MBQ2103917.1 STAS domain-containing protein [Bacteroidales bacterium]MBQ2501632.1 STAS domain-containing protein [Bacteroidales bacterium]MBQ5417184.1 STAS domain-containing protein [Bacteroidales bacterium]
MEAKILENNAVITVELIGRLDTAAAQEVSEKLLPLQEKADRTIVLDCSQLNYISSSGLRIFLALRKASAVKGGKVIVKSINDDIRTVFMMTGFLNLFEIEA